MPSPVSRRPSPARVLLAVLVLAGSAADRASAQRIGYAAVAAVGRSSWSPGFGADGRWGVTYGAVAAEVRARKGVALRAEMGGGSRTADLGRTGLFSQATHLTYYMANFGFRLRAYTGSLRGGPALFAEAGAIGWLRTACDVDLVGGPGFLGGETETCREWLPDAPSPVEWLFPRGSGVSWGLGVGARRGPWGLALRYEFGGGPLLESSAGALHARTLHLAVEWFFRRRD